MTYQFGSFRLDTAKRRLWRGDELIALTPKAFDTLMTLVVRAGQVVEKDDLLKAVWADTFVEEATLAQNISTLRRALSDTADTPAYIATVPRRGYRFVETVTVLPETPHAAVEPATDIPGSASGDATTWHSRAADAPPPIAAKKTHERLWMAVSALLALAVLAIAIRGTQQVARIAPVVFSISPPEGTTFSTSGGFMAVAPNGRAVTFIAAARGGPDTLWVRSLDSLTAHALTGTEGASQPFWSSDGQSIAFFVNGKLKRIRIDGGPVQTICDIPLSWIPLAGTWNRSDDILFPSVQQDIMHVAATGGVARPVVSKGPADTYVGWPQFLPDGRHFLYVLGSTHPDEAGIYVGSLDSTERVRIAPHRSSALYAPTGHLLFVAAGMLVAQPFDANERKLTGTPTPLAERVAFNAGTSRGSFSISQNGVLAYREVAETQLVWFDRDGKRQGTATPVGNYLQFSVAPSSGRIAAARLDSQTGTSDIWIIDTTSGTEQRLTFDAAWETFPLWSRDESTIVFNSNRTGRGEIYEKASSGNGPERRLAAAGTLVVPTDVSADGEVLYQQSGLHSERRFWLIAPGGEQKPMRLPVFDPDENDGRISPNGQWLAFTVYQGGMAVYVRPLHSVESRWQISPAGGTGPRWRGDGRELFYLSPDLSVMASEIAPGPQFRAAPARRLFQTQAIAPSGVVGQAYDVTPDGQRFLVKVPASFSPITVVVNWTSLFGK